MALREVVYEELSPDERCRELYGTGKAELLHQLRLERRRIRRQSKPRRTADDTVGTNERGDHADP